MCSIDIDDPAELRKTHACDVCGSSINPGEAYLRNTYLADGEWRSAGKACAVCKSLYESFRDAHNGGYGPEMLVESLCDCVEDSLRKTEYWNGKRHYNGRQDWFVEAKQRGRQWRTALAIIKQRSRKAKLATVTVTGDSNKQAVVPGP